MTLLIGLVLDHFLPTVPLPREAAMVVGWVLLAIAVGCSLAACNALWRAKTTVFPNRPASRLVTDGIFRFTRNPMYLSLTLGYAGTACVLDIFWSLVLIPVAVVIVMRRVIRTEEAYLAQTFGDSYIAYQQRVRRWI